MFGGQTSTQAGGERAGRRVRIEARRRRRNPRIGPHGGGHLARDDDGRHDRGARLPHGHHHGARRRGRPTGGSATRPWRPAAGSSRKTRCKSSAWRCWAAKRRRSCSAKSRPEGEEITINGLRFTVVGVLKTKTQIANYNTPDNECLFIPYETASLFRDLQYPDDVVWMPANPVFREQAVRAGAGGAGAHPQLLPQGRACHTEFRVQRIHAAGGHHGDRACSVLLGFIGTLTLAIGGVGLANIMLVSVTQRTREIGVLKSIGATRRAILWQFLLEAMAIVTAGRRPRRSGGLGPDRAAGNPSAARPAVQGHQRGRRHPFEDFGLCGDHFHAAARNRRSGGGPAAGHQSGAPGPDRGTSL